MSLAFHEKAYPASLIALAVFVVFGLSPAVLAANDEENIQIVRYAEIPPHVRFSVEAAQNTELASAAQAGIEKSLERRGIGYGLGSSLVITVGAEKVGGKAPPPQAVFDQGTGRLHISIGSPDTPQTGPVADQ